MIKLNDFGVAVENWGDRSVLHEFSRNGFRYVAMKDTERYALCLANMRSTPCDAEITIDGKKIGRFRVSASSIRSIDSPHYSNRSLLFVRESGEKAQKAGGGAGESSNGLVEVVFFPSDSEKPSSRGIEIEVDKDMQTLFKVPDITNIDDANVTTIRFRMV